MHGENTLAWKPSRVRLAAALALSIPAVLFGQTQNGSNPPMNNYPQPSAGTSGGSTNGRLGNPGAANGHFDLGFPGSDPNFSHRQLTARREELHKRMVENASHLLALARELQEDLQSHGATESDGKRLDDIAKLARAVRDGMRQ